MSSELELLRLHQVVLGYQRALLPPLDLVVRRGARLAVLGPNGGGKSTLLKTLIGLVKPLAGRRELPLGRAPRVGYVPQAHRVDPVYPLSALEVVMQGRYGRIGVGRAASAQDRSFARQQLERVRLSEVAQTPFRSLSGGQRQRVLLARALCGEPELLVLDEFTSDLDPAAASALLTEVSRLARDGGVGVLFVTHEISAAAAHSSELALVDTRSQVFESGSTQELLTGERLSRLYGQSIKVERRGNRTVVFVEAEEEAAP